MAYNPAYYTDDLLNVGFNTPSYYGDYDDPNVDLTQQQAQQRAQANVPGKDTGQPNYAMYADDRQLPGYNDYPGAPAEYPQTPSTPTAGADRSGGDRTTQTDQPTSGAPPGEGFSDTTVKPAGTANPYSDAAFQTALRALPANGASVRKVIAEHPEWGITVYNTKADKVKLADGRIVDVGFSFANPATAAWQWLDVSGEGGTGGYAAYAPPPTPMIMPNGLVPPGMPYQPSAEQTGMQDALLKQIMTQPTYSPEYLGQLQEGQKEQILQRQRRASRGQQQSAASRGVYGGGANTAAQRRLRTDAGNQLLQSQRDLSLQTTGANRQGFLDALGTSQNIFGNRFNNSLALQQFLEAIREYGVDDAYRYALANQQGQQFYDQLLLGGS